VHGPPDTPPIIGQRLARLNLPRDFLVIHIRRQGEGIMPHGDTMLCLGDVVTFLVPKEDAEVLRAYWQRLVTPTPAEKAAPKTSEALTEFVFSAIWT